MVFIPFRWICNGKLVCGEEPCRTAEGSLSCPKYFYLCGSECKPDFVSCGDKCQDHGFYCDKQNDNVTVYDREGHMHLTSTFVFGLSHKRIVPFRKNPKFHDYDYVNYLNLMIKTCSSIYQGTGEDQKERCCLPLDFQCDGAMDCLNGENTVKFWILCNIDFVIFLFSG